MNTVPTFKEFCGGQPITYTSADGVGQSVARVVGDHIEHLHPRKRRPLSLSVTRDSLRVIYDHLVARVDAVGEDDLADIRYTLDTNRRSDTYQSTHGAMHAMIQAPHELVRANRILAMIDSDNPGERENAVQALSRFLTTHPAKNYAIVSSTSNDAETALLLKDMYKRMNELAEENSRMRAGWSAMEGIVQDHEPALLKQINKRWMKTQWNDFYEKVNERLFLGKPPQKTSEWFKQVANYFEMTTDTLKSAAAGSARLHEYVYEWLEMLAPEKCARLHPIVAENERLRARVEELEQQVAQSSEGQLTNAELEEDISNLRKKLDIILTDFWQLITDVGHVAARDKEESLEERVYTYEFEMGEILRLYGRYGDPVARTDEDTAGVLTKLEATVADLEADKAELKTKISKLEAQSKTAAPASPTASKRVKPADEAVVATIEQHVNAATDKSMVSTTELMALLDNKNLHDRLVQRQIAQVMRDLGWRQTTNVQTTTGRKIRGWVHPDRRAAELTKRHAQKAEDKRSKAYFQAAGTINDAAQGQMFH